MKTTQYTATQFLKTLAQGPFAWPGGYPLFFITSDGESLSFETAEENKEQILDAIWEGDSSGWRVIGCEANWEDPSYRRVVEAETALNYI